MHNHTGCSTMSKCSDILFTLFRILHESWYSDNVRKGQHIMSINRAMFWHGTFEIYPKLLRSERQLNGTSEIEANISAFKIHLKPEQLECCAKVSSAQ